MHVDDHRRCIVHPGGEPCVFGILNDLGDISEINRRARAVGNDDAAVFCSRTQLIVGIDGIGAQRTIKAALGLIDVGRADTQADVFEIQPLGRKRLRVNLYSHRRPLAAIECHQPNAGDLRNLLCESCIYQALHLRQWQRCGSHAQRQNRRIGRIYLAVDRRRGQIGRQQIGGGVNRGLDLLLGDIQIELEVELQRNDGCATGVGR